MNFVSTSTYGSLTIEGQRPSSSTTSGRRLCLAFRPAGRATSSGFDRDKGCPGGAIGLRMLSKTGLEDFPFPFLPGVLFLAIFEPAAMDGSVLDASSGSS
jgi:hypothetical protein